LIKTGCRAPEERSPRGRRDAEVVGGPRIGAVRLTALIPCGKYRTLILVLLYCNDPHGVYIKVHDLEAKISNDLEYKKIVVYL
jgi:hypothetical protein